MSTYPPVSLTDVYDLIQTLSGGGATTQQILDAINYISRGQTWDLKEVADGINNNNNSLFNGDSGGPSLLFDQATALTAAQTLSLIYDDGLFDANTGLTASKTLSLIEASIQALTAQLAAQDAVINALIDKTNRILQPLYTRGFILGSTLTTVFSWEDFTATTPAGWDVGGEVETTIYNRTNKSIELADPLGNELLEIQAGSSANVTGIVINNTGFLSCWIKVTATGTTNGKIFVESKYITL